MCGESLETILGIMKLNSKYFDSIRVAPKREREEEASKKRHPMCQWKGCGRPAPHRAPKGRGKDGEYFAFCIDHVRAYNASYNYFDGMSDSEVTDFQKDAMTGHRPTWKVGANSWAHGTREARAGLPGGRLRPVSRLRIRMGCSRRAPARRATSRSRSAAATCGRLSASRSTPCTCRTRQRRTR